MPETSDLISRRAVELALIEKGQASKRYKVGEFWELNGEEIREALASVPSAQPERKTGTSDLISRKAVIDALDKRFDSVPMEQTTEILMLRKDLRELPSVEPERRTGKWIEVNDAYNRISGRCSVCGWESHLYEDDVVGMDYCPNCRARLETE